MLAKILLLVSLVVGSLVSLAVAETRILPGQGVMFLEVENVCVHMDGGNVKNTTVRTATVAGDVSSESLYPFSIEVLYDNVLVHVLGRNSSSNGVLMQTDWGACVHMNETERADYVSYWTFLRTLLTTVYSDSVISGEEIEYRAINSITAETTATLTIPRRFGGTGTAMPSKLTYVLNKNGWSLNYQRDVEHSPLTVVVSSNPNGTPTTECTLTFSYVGTGVTSASAFDTPEWCGGDTDNRPIGSERARQVQLLRRRPAVAAARKQQAMSAAAAAAAAPALEDSAGEADTPPNSPPIPALPNTFSANFQVIMPQQKAIFFMRHSYNNDIQTCYSTVQAVHPDAAGRVALAEWYVTGVTQLTYFHQVKSAAGTPPVINPKVQEYFWPNKDVCSRSLIGYNEFAASPERLLLMIPEVTPMFVGNRTARNIPCGVWSAPVNGTRVSWYFASNEAMYEYFHSPFDADGSAPIWTPEERYAKLVRITVEGYGDAAPLFVHHPFFAQGYAFPKADRWSACRALTPREAPPGCDGLSEDNYFFFYYDVTGFVAHVPFADYSVPEACAKTLTGSAFPTAMFALHGYISPGAAGFLLFLAWVIGMLMCAGFSHCMYSSNERTMQEMMVALTEEIRKNDASQGAEEDGAAEDEREVPAEAAGDPKHNMGPI